MTEELYSLLGLRTKHDELTIEQVSSTQYRVHATRSGVIGNYSTLREAMNVVSAFLKGTGRYTPEFANKACHHAAYKVEKFDPMNPEMD